MSIEDLDILKWRGAKSPADREIADAFAARAAEVRSQVAFLLGGGLTDGAVEALGALAEEDMVDFCIMVDLAMAVAIPDVEPLDATTQLHLREFLDGEPWRSLAIDNDITIALAMIEDLLQGDADTPWYRTSPALPALLANLMDRVDREQFARFAGELDTRVRARNQRTSGGLAVIYEIVRAGARRVGAPPPGIGADS